MGRKDRERIERIRKGLEIPIAGRVVRKALSVASRSGVVEEMSRGTVSDQVSNLDELVGEGALPEGRLKKAIMNKAPKEMDKAIKKYRKQGKEITVDSLLSEVRSTQGFLKMCEKVGLDYGWFERLARERMEAQGI